VLDLLLAIRALRATPVVTFVAILSLALGIGANTAIFSLVNSLLIRSLPVRAPGQLALIQGGSWTNPIWEQIRARQSTLFDGAVAWGNDTFDLAAGGPSQPVDGMWVSGGFFDVLGVAPILGRTFTTDDDRRGGGSAGPVAVISYRFWQRHFSGAAAAVGRPLTLNGLTYTVIGITGPEFLGPVVGRSFEVAIPIGSEPLMHGKESWLDARSTWWLDVIVRLKRDQSIEDAAHALNAVRQQIRQATLPQDWPADMLKQYLGDPLALVSAIGGAPNVRNRYREPLVIVMVTVGLVLLIACANIANLMLARANARRHELSLRLAMGASQLRIARQLLTESLLLAGAGAALGLLFAQWGSGLLVQQLTTYEETILLDLSLDWRVLAFTAGVAVTTALLFGVVPAFRAGRVEPSEALKEHGRTVAGERTRMLGQPLVVLQVALSLVLVVGAGLFLRTFANLAAVNLGFDRDPLLIVGLDLQRGGIAQSDRLGLVQRLEATARRVPGVSRATLSNLTPVSGRGWNNGIEVPGGRRYSEREMTVMFNGVSPGYFATYGTTLLAGRDFAATDREGAPLAAIVNQAFAAKFIGPEPQKVLGRTIRLARPPHNGEPIPSYRIVGVVESAAYLGPRDGTPPTIYLPYAQAVSKDWPSAFLTVRSNAGRPSLLVKSVASALGRVDPRVSLSFLTMREQFDAKLVSERIVAMLSGFFGALALLLAGIGLYGVTSYGVSRRRMEIGIRMALGADAGTVVRLVLGRVALLVGLGVIIGAVACFYVSRFVEALVFGLEPRDVTTQVGAALVLAAVGVLAAWLPARRASRIDPIEVLREG
jgi:putative ABC transport system permease protein